jgi:hypothetical protein
MNKPTLYFFQATLAPQPSSEPEFLEPWPAPDEQLTKDLQAFYSTLPSLRRAYLVRLAAPWPQVGLCLAIVGDEDPEIVNRSTFVWNWHMGRTASLLLIFLPSALETRLQSVCPPFYAAA